MSELLELGMAGKCLISSAEPIGEGSRVVEIARMGKVTRKPHKADFYAGMTDGESDRPLPDDASRDYKVGHAVGMNIREKAGEGI
tara:strand:- start:605 stop:859 length:255 start_codon:yes stop_codon:yes gene_type:complete